MYSQEKINQMKQHIHNHGYATNYTEPTWYLVSTLVLYICVLYLIHIGKGIQWAWILLLALLNMRLFMIFHDMCHRSFYPTDERNTNTNGFNFQMASIIEVWASFSANYWNNIHSTHHGALGNINEYDGTRTVMISSEYEKLPDFAKRIYDIVRFPPIFFLLAPLYIYWINRVISMDWIYIIKYSVWLFLLFRLGSWKLLLSFLASQYIAGLFGLILFHLQHQVNDGFWGHINKKDTLKKENAYLSASTVLDIPWWLEYFTNGIEYHNIHHLDPGIPSYHTKRVYYELVNKGLLSDEKIGMSKAWESLWHTIYNERTGKYG
jgi:omega-6 fatty acid desaturase (delta-12 desaturase)